VLRRGINERIFDLADQKFQIRLVKIQLWRGNAVMFDIGWDMLVVRVGAG